MTDVLIVEDERLAAKEIASILTEYGHNIIGNVASKDDAITVVEGNIPDIALVDISLKRRGKKGRNEDGIFVSEEISRRFNVPTVFLTGFSDNETVKRAKVNAYGFVIKPIEERKILIALEVALDRKASERKIHKLSMAVSNSYEGIMMTAPDGTIEYVNDAFCSITGNSEESSLGKHMRFLKGGKHSSGFYEKMWTEIESGNTWSGQDTFKKPNGELFDVDLSIFPLYEGTDNLRGYVYVMNDITQQIKLNQWLQHAQRLQSIGNLASGIGHELNNALSPSFGYLELILSDVSVGRVPETLQADLESSSIGMDRAIKIIRSMLEFSRKRDRSVNKPVQTVQIVKSVVSLVKGSMKLSNIEILLNLKEVPSIFIDENEIRQVVQNIVFNAVYSMSELGGKLSVCVDSVSVTEAFASERCLHSKDCILIDIEDTGTGISEEVVEQIFDPFFTTKPVGVGTGLGLFVSYSIVVSHGGTIVVESQYGRGTIVKVYFPITKDDQLLESASKEIKKGVENLNILIVDDERTNLKILTRMLENLGHTVVSEGNPETALQIYRDSINEFDLILTDYGMDPINGAQLAAKVKSINACCPIVMISGYSKENIDPDESRYFDGFIIKPANRKILTEQIRIAYEKCYATS